LSASDFWGNDIKNIIQQIKKLLFQKRAGMSVVSFSSLTGYIDRSHLVSPHLIRLGTPYGGWLIPRSNVLAESSICYLVGAGEDISFDCALVKQFCCIVRIVDPTPRAVQHFRGLKLAVEEHRRFPINNSDVDHYEIASPDMERMTFLPFGLADTDAELRFYMPRNPAHVSCSTVNLQRTDTYFTAQCYRLSSLMTMQRDEQVDLLKIDIEGGEYVVIKDLLASNLLPRILLVEFDEAHTPLDNDAGKRIKESIKELVDAGMRCIAVEGSNATFIRTW
jgi:FkbM family methyltransferase